mmetsp:Transcript_15480/g.45698  ORF Transcript_15480/g.45698 Transcript_15480/m.45698 type:complete len:204 (+) Transcript_15480:2317-2928(+)
MSSNMDVQHQSSSESTSSGMSSDMSLLSTPVLPALGFGGPNRFWRNWSILRNVASSMLSKSNSSSPSAISSISLGSTSTSASMWSAMTSDCSSSMISTLRSLLTGWSLAALTPRDVASCAAALGTFDLCCPWLGDCSGSGSYFGGATPAVLRLPRASSSSGSARRDTIHMLSNSVSSMEPSLPHWFSGGLYLKMLKKASFMSL